MDHQQAQQQMSVERYLMGELSGPARGDFEDHLFDCAACTRDLRAGVQMLEGVRAEAAIPGAGLAPSPAVVPARRPESWRRLFSPLWLTPALAASLALIAFQSSVTLQRLRTQLAAANAPGLVQGLAFAGETRGDTVPQVAASADGSFLLGIDIPPGGGYAGYRCELDSADGRTLWRLAIPADVVRDTVEIRVPASAAQAGENTLRILGLAPESGAATEIASHRFRLSLR